MKATGNRHEIDTDEGRREGENDVDSRFAQVSRRGLLRLTTLGVAGIVGVSSPGAAAEPLPHTLTIAGVGNYTEYVFSVSGNLSEDAGLTGEDEISDGTAVGAIRNGTDSYRFSGTVTEFDLDGDATLYRNGKETDVTEIRYPHTLAIIGNGGRTEYAFSVSGTLIEKSGLTGEDTITGSDATGAVGGGRDSYAFSGELVDLTVDGNATVTLDGEVIDADPSPLLGVHNGLSDANFATIDRIEEWQETEYPVQNFFVPWDASVGHMDWLFEKILPKVHDAGRVPLITWEPFTPATDGDGRMQKNAPRSVRRTPTVADAQAIVERGDYDAYRRSLASATPDDIEVRIAEGEFDDYIDEWAGRLREWLAGPDGVLGTDDDRRASLRLGHEMNGDWYPWAPTVGNSPASSYAEMWRHVHDRFASAGVENVEWMWCVNADDAGSYTAEELYPGDSYVDWLSIDGYQWGESEGWSDWESPESVFGEMLGRVRAIADKPVCIAETASTTRTTTGRDPEKKGEWIADAFAYFDEEDVDLWCWFNEDKGTDWAMFGGERGTETVVHDGESVNAYTAYREGVDSYADASSATALDAGPTTGALSGDD